MSIQVLEDPEYEQIIKLINTGSNIFITGPGGTGKSTLVRRIVNEYDNTQVTAMTGCAALLLDCSAKTLHSWSGIGLGKDTLEKCVANILKKSYIKKRWTGTRKLIIDEVSMLTPELFERLDKIGRAVRKQSTKPFGGLQLILVGDFCQLPPIPKDLSGAEVDLRFLFESSIWSSTIQNIILLNKIWRQMDPIYQNVLSEVRMGVISAESEKILRSRMNTNWKEETIKPTVLFSRNAEVDKVNIVNMEALSGEKASYEAKTVIDKSRWTDTERAMPDMSSDLVQFAIEKLDQDATYMPHLNLRIGAQVMLITNMDLEAGLVNGSRGVIVDFEPIRRFPIVKFKRGEPRAIEPFTWFSHDMPHVGRLQIPLRIAYAITIHKSQGASIDSAIVDIGKSTFEYGQAYVALSRVRSLDGLHIFALDLSKIRTHPRVLEFYSNLVSKQELLVKQPDVIVSDFWSTTNVHTSWIPLLTNVLNSPEGKSLEMFITSEKLANKIIYPPRHLIFNCLSISLESIKVVILGQDPYHGPGQAMGLSFSVPDEMKAPPSLKNILKEVSSDLGVVCCYPNLTSWFEQGVLLLNTILTVEDGKPLSHANKGWEIITDTIIKEIVTKRTGVVFILWGKQAQKKASLISAEHTILESAHPSPLSAHNGFFGCKHFSKANEILGPKAIKWV